MEIPGGVGKSSEDERFPIGFAVAIDRRLTNLGFDEGFQFSELAIAFGCYGFRLLKQKLQLRAIISDRF